MKYCSDCGTSLRPTDKFCPECGKPTGVSPSTQRVQVFEGNIHKCPNCGETINSFVSNCPSCGFEFRNTKASSAVKEFSDKIEQLLTQSNASKKKSHVEAQILEQIRNFTVPNTKEDVLEFMILASSNINLSAASASNFSDAGANNDEEWNAMKARNDAWLSKVEQVYQKAKITFGNDSNFHKIQEIYLRTVTSLKDAQKKRKKRELIIVSCVVGGMLLLGLSPFIIKGVSHSNKEKQFEQIVEEIEVDIANKNFDAALVKASKLHMDDDWSHESEEHWDERREYLIQLIQKAKEENKK